MLNKNEMQVMKQMFSNLNAHPTIREISIILKQKYSQTFKIVKSLKNKKLINLKNIGKSSILSLNFSEELIEYIAVEVERTNEFFHKNKKIFLIASKLNESAPVICILFGSYARGNFNKKSDLDFVFIIPKNSDKTLIEKQLKNKLSLYNIDFNFLTEENIFEMWQNKNELNVGNEILKNHYILSGYDYFIKLLRKNYGK